MLLCSSGFFATILRICAGMALLALPAHAQDVDDGYAPTPDGSVTHVIVQTDGGALIAGEFTQVDGHACRRVCRLLADGSVDPAFADPDIDGKVYAMAVQPDGCIVVGGSFSTIDGQARGNLARLRADGHLDESFADPAVDNAVEALLPRADGRLLVGGRFNSIGGQWHSRVALLDGDGSLDAGFVDPRIDQNVTAMAQQADGRILVAGNFTQVSDEPRHYLARLRADGSLDTSFADPALDQEITAMLRLPDGKVLVSGYFTTFRGQPRNRLLRLAADGQLDTSFGTENLLALAMAVQADGKILLGGGSFAVGAGFRSGIARINADGSTDEAFLDPAAGGPMGGSIAALAVQADGNILIGGTFATIRGQARSNIARLAASGHLDATITESGSDDWVYALAMLRDGRMLVGGGTANSFPNGSGYGTSKAGLLRFTESVSDTLAGTGVKMFAMDPGLVRTSMTDYQRSSEAGQRYLPDLPTLFDNRIDVPPTMAARLSVEIASGRFDALAGRMLMAARGDLDLDADAVQAIIDGDLRSLRVNGMPKERPRAE